MKAFNRLTQQWVEGPGARNLRHDQIKADLHMLRGVDGEHYAERWGIKDRQAAIVRLENKAKELAALVL